MSNFISSTVARNSLSKFIDILSSGKKSAFVIGRRDNPEAVLIPFPKHFNKNVSDITNVNSYSKSFDFLEDEPDLYSLKDILK